MWARWFHQPGQHEQQIRQAVDVGQGERGHRLGLGQGGDPPLGAPANGPRQVQPGPGLASPGKRKARSGGSSPCARSIACSSSTSRASGTTALPVGCTAPPARPRACAPRANRSRWTLLKQPRHVGMRQGRARHPERRAELVQRSVGLDPQHVLADPHTRPAARSHRCRRSACRSSRQLLVAASGPRAARRESDRGASVPRGQRAAGWHPGVPGWSRHPRPTRRAGGTAAAPHGLRIPLELEQEQAPVPDLGGRLGVQEHQALDHTQGLPNSWRLT